MPTLTIVRIENGFLVQVMTAGMFPPGGPIHYAKDQIGLLALVERLVAEVAR